MVVTPVQAEREAKRVQREAEAEREKGLRHMLKLRRHEGRRVVHVSLSIDAAVLASGNPPAVRLAFGFPEKVVGATRLRDGIERIMSEYDYTSKSEAFNKNHRWMQLLDSVELGLQVA